MDVIAKPKKWGNSVGVIIPKEIVERENITLKDELILHIEKRKDKEKKSLMKEGYIEMQKELEKINKEWKRADSKWPSR
jgi:antitoxin component of MazEF toxin-antitoxin module